MPSPPGSEASEFPHHGAEDIGGPVRGAAPAKSLNRPANVDESVGTSWTLLAYNERVAKGWANLCQATPANARNCYNWLQVDPLRQKNGRCYPLKGKKYAGVWAYEIGAGDRVYYIPSPEDRKLVVYYAGPHPKVTPEPPTAF
jgi:hypothetical protein